MYRFSRSIYRELSPFVQENGVTPVEARRHLLDASEETMRRLAVDRRYFARPARSLFTDVRSHFPIRDQLYVYEVIERHIALALEHLEQLPDDAVGLDGQPRQCRASTRKGKPCQREPLPGRDYCPSHKHLEEESDFSIPEELEPSTPVGAAA
jgi:hypothetical protein